MLHHFAYLANFSEPDSQQFYYDRADGSVAPQMHGFFEKYVQRLSFRHRLENEYIVTILVRTDVLVAILDNVGLL